MQMHAPFVHVQGGKDTTDRQESETKKILAMEKTRIKEKKHKNEKFCLRNLPIWDRRRLQAVRLPHRRP